MIVILFSLFWRFANYNERWTLSQDQARDGIIGLHMVENFTLPLVGPPSSAGNFSFGPYYYWLIALFTLIIPVVNGSWIGFTLLSVGTSILFFYIGKQFAGNIMGLLFGIITAFSSELIFHSTDMLNPIPISFLVALLFLLIIKLVDHRNIIYSLFIGFIIGLSINFHLQALGLLTVIPIISIFNTFNKNNKLKVLGLSLFGLFISFIPLLIFNFSHQNILLNYIYSFIFGGQTSSGVENNIFSDLVFFWPQLWGQTIAHFPLLGYIFILLLLFAGVFSIGEKKTLTKSFYVIGITFLFQVLFLLVYQGVRSPVYLIVFHSFFVFLLGWILLNFYNFNKYIGLGVFIVILLITVPANIKIVKNNGSQISTIMSIKEQIDQTLNNSDVYVLNDQSSNMLSLPIYYLYKKENRVYENGNRIVLCENKLIKTSDGITEKWSCPIEVPVIAEYDKYKVYAQEKLSNDLQEVFLEMDSTSIYNSLFKTYLVK